MERKRVTIGCGSNRQRNQKLRVGKKKKSPPGLLVDRIKCTRPPPQGKGKKRVMH